MKIFELFFNTMKLNIKIDNYYLLVIWRIFLIYLIYTITRVFFIIFNWPLLEPVTLLQLLRIFTGGLLFDTSAILYTNILYIVLAFLPFTFVKSSIYQRIVKWIYVVANSICIVVNIADSVYFSYTMRRTSSSFLNEFQGDVKFLKIISESFAMYWYVFLIGIAMIALLVYLSGQYSKTGGLYDCNLSNGIKYYNNKSFGYRFYIRQSAALLLSVPIFIIGVRGGITPTKKPITISNAGDYVDRAIHASAVLNTPFSIIRTIGKADFTHQKFYASYEDADRVYMPVHNIEGSADAKVSADTAGGDAIKLKSDLSGKNIVILLLEGFNYENMKFLNKKLSQSYTPFLDSLSRHSLLCTNAFANGRKSIDAIPSVFISLPSLIQSYAVTPYSTDYTYGLPKILDTLGYHTAFFHGAPNTSMGIRAVSRLLGIMNYFGKDEYNNNDHFDGAWGIWDEHFLQYTALQLDKLPQPFFANIFTLSSHHPFLIPDEYQDVFNEGTPRQRVIKYTDMALRKFFSSIENKEWFKNTLFVLVSDHSVLVGEDPVYNTTIGNTRIPIIYYAPELIVPGTYDGVTQQIDIMPTLLGMLGYDRPYFAFGRDINKKSSPEFAINYAEGQYQLVVGDTLLLRNDKILKAVYLLDEDPLLRNNLLESPDAALSIESPELKSRNAWFEAFIQQYVNRLIDDKLTAE